MSERSMWNIITDKKTIVEEIPVIEDMSALESIVARSRFTAMADLIITLGRKFPIEVAAMLSEIPSTEFHRIVTSITDRRNEKR